MAIRPRSGRFIRPASIKHSINGSRGESCTKSGCSAPCRHPWCRAVFEDRKKASRAPDGAVCPAVSAERRDLVSIFPCGLHFPSGKILSIMTRLCQYGKTRCRSLIGPMAINRKGRRWGSRGEELTAGRVFKSSALRVLFHRKKCRPVFDKGRKFPVIMEARRYARHVPQGLFAKKGLRCWQMDPAEVFAFIGNAFCDFCPAQNVRGRFSRRKFFLPGARGGRSKPFGAGSFLRECFL